MVRLCVFAFVIVTFSSSRLFGQFLFRPIVVTGQPTDITVFVGSQTSSQVSDTIIGVSGDVIFGGSIQTPTGSEDGIWVHRPSLSRVELRAKENLPAPGPDGIHLNAVFGDANGQATFGALKVENQTGFTYRARLKGGDTTPNNNTAVYREGILVIREGDLFDSREAPIIGDLFEFAGLAQETIRRPFPVRNVEPSADTAFQVPPFTDSFPREGVQIFSQQRFLGDLRDVRPLTFPRSLDVVFRGSVTGQGVTETNDERIFLAPFGGSNRPIEIAREGEPLATDQSVQFDSFFHPATGLNNDRLHRVSYGARLNGPAVNAANDSAIVQQPPSPSPSTRLLLKEGHAVTGGGAGVVLGDLGTDNIIGGGNFSVLFNNQVVGPGISERNDWALIAAFMNRVGTVSPQVVAQEGATVSGLPPDSVLTGVGPEMHCSMRMLTSRSHN
jgi:hypothetical protein